MIEDAQVQTTELVSEHEIMQQAYAQANEIVTQATAQAQEIIDNATMDANAIRIGAIQYTDDLLANAESIIGHTLDSYTTKYDGLINSLQECYDVVRTNRAELEDPGGESGRLQRAGTGGTVISDTRTCRYKYLLNDKINERVNVKITQGTGSQSGCQFFCKVGKNRQPGFLYHGLCLHDGAESAE